MFFFNKMKNFFCGSLFSLKYDFSHKNNFLFMNIKLDVFFFFFCVCVCVYVCVCVCVCAFFTGINTQTFFVFVSFSSLKIERNDIVYIFGGFQINVKIWGF